MKVPYYISGLLQTELDESSRLQARERVAQRAAKWFTRPNTAAERSLRHSRFDGFATDTQVKDNGYGFDNVISGLPGEANDINSGFGNITQHVETLIPDAYSVEITLQSLIPESKNLFFQSILGHNTLNTGIFQETAADSSMRVGADVKDLIDSPLSQDTSVLANKEMSWQVLSDKYNSGEVYQKGGGLYFTKTDTEVNTNITGRHIQASEIGY
jgi:hypothetical protein